VEAADACSGVPDRAAPAQRLERGWARHALPETPETGRLDEDGIWEGPVEAEVRRTPMTETEHDVFTDSRVKR
jgi:hypothetical protein